VPESILAGKMTRPRDLVPSCFSSFFSIPVFFCLIVLREGCHLLSKKKERVLEFCLNLKPLSDEGHAREFLLEELRPFD
jgi:hypothetical protein